MSWTIAWRPYFDPRVRMRGQCYHDEQRVRLLDAQPGQLAQAAVQGNQEYQVTIASGNEMTATCTCPMFRRGSYCKHIWATLVTLDTQPAAPLSSDAPPAPLKARKRSAAAAPPRRAEPEWIGRLSLIRLIGGGTEPPAPTGGLAPPTQVCYVVRADLCITHRGLIVELRQRQPTQSGSQRLRALKIANDMLHELADPVDRELCALILGGHWVNHDEDGSMYRDDRGRSMFKLQPGTWRSLLARMIQTGRGFVDDDQNRPSPLTWDDGPAWRLWAVGRETQEGLLLGVELRRDEQRMDIHEPRVILGGHDGLLIAAGQAGRFDDVGATRWMHHFREDDTRSGRETSPIEVPRQDIERFVERLYTMPQLPELDLPEHLAPPVEQLEPRPQLEIISTGSPTGRSNQLGAQVAFRYGQAMVEPTQAARFVLDLKPGELPGTPPPDAAQTAPNGMTTASRLIRRDLEQESRALSQLVELGFKPAGSRDPFGLSLPARRLPIVVPTLLGKGWAVRADEKLIRSPNPPRLQITSGVDWFELRGSVQFETDQGVQELELGDILSAVRSGQHMVELGDGSQGMLPQEWLAQQGLLEAVGQWHEDHLRFRFSQAALLDTLLREQAAVDVDEQFEQLRQRLYSFEQVQPADPTPRFRGQLRSYQREGLGWMLFLRWFGMGGILADDMGLGKTVQVLSLLDHHQHQQQQQAAQLNGSALPAMPSLIVVPRSVIFNWVDEAQRFAPHLKVLNYTGNDRQALRDSFGEHDLIVTSYGLMRRDIQELREYRFEYVVLDEAQTIKNPMSQAAKAARLLQANHRLALTGTPVENHLGDLWSIFEFLNPGMLGSGTRFAELIRSSTTATQTRLDADQSQTAPSARQVQVMQLASALQPFILRRTKRQVLKDLPDKTEQTILCQMPRAQRKIYDTLRTHYRGTLLQKWSNTNPGSTMMVLEALLRLRQACCHPALIDPVKHQDVGSVKIDTLMDSLTELIEEGSKALVFSQFTGMLSLVRQRLDQAKIPYEYLDGQTRDRKQRVERFQNDAACPVFLISLKAGGLGLNLTAAEYVFILDPWWNPAVEAQAIDRTHRIGQTRRVFAYRLICQDTVEQRIVELQQKKKELADAIVGNQQNLLKNLTREDLEALLS